MKKSVEQIEKPILLLFDIDGTILSTHGLPRKAMKRVLERRFNYFSYDDSYNYSGRTDWQIVDHLLDIGEIEYPRNIDSLKIIFNDFSVELEKEITNGLKPHVYDGVSELIQALHKSDNCYLGLLTGNIADGARIKLEAAKLYDFFPSGAFGDDAKNRNDLADIAIQRLEKYYKISFDKNNTWIVGDSIHDVRCANENGLCSLAVCTGMTTRSELENELPQFIVESFEDTESILEIICNGTTL